MRTGERNCVEDSLSRFECCKRTRGDVLGNKASGWEFEHVIHRKWRYLEDLWFVKSWCMVNVQDRMEWSKEENLESCQLLNTPMRYLSWGKGNSLRFRKKEVAETEPYGVTKGILCYYWWVNYVRDIMFIAKLNFFSASYYEICLFYKCSVLILAAWDSFFSVFVQLMTEGKYMYWVVIL